MSDAEPVVAVIEGEPQEEEKQKEEEQKEEKPAEEEDKKAPEQNEVEEDEEAVGALIPAAVYMAAEGDGGGEQDVLHRIAARQSKIVRAALDALAAEDPDARRAAKAGADDDEIARRRVGALLSAAADFRVLSRALEDDIFGERAMRRLQIQPNGCLDHDPKLNFYPPFVLPEALATYHLFFQNQVIPLSCRANRPDADAKLAFAQGDALPDTATLQEVPRIFDGLGSEVQPLDSKSLQKAEAVDQGEESQGALIELEGDSPRLAVLKRSIRVTHAAYPALALPPKVMTALMENLIMARPEAKKDKGEGENEPEPGAEPVVDDDTLARWLGLPAAKQVKTLDERERREKALVERRRLLHSVVLVSVTQACLRRFFARRDMVRRLGESIHYLFKHGYVRQACRVAEVELTHLVSYMGLMHENRVGHSVLHSTLEGEARRDYVRDTLYLLLVYTWQTAMGAWQQCLDPTNVLELAKILRRKRRDLWSGFDERTISEELSRLVFPEPLLDALAQGLPDIAHQSQLHNFRSFILERSGILPAMCNALPTDFVPLYYREAPPQLWGHVFLLRLASFLMYQNDLAELPFDGESSPLLECHCRCNLCSPHRSLIHNTALLNEVQCIGSFQLQAPPTTSAGDGEQQPQQQQPLTLTPAVWTNAYLKKFEDDDFYHDVIRHYELQKSPQARAPLTACVITAPAIVAQLQNIAAARREFLAKKGSGVYLDPVTGDVLGTGRSPAPVTARTAPAVTAHGGSTSILRLPPSSSSSSSPQPHHRTITTAAVAAAAEHETTDAEDHHLLLAARRALEALGNQSDPLYSEKLVQAVEDYTQQLRRRENGPDASLAGDAWRRRVSVERELDRFLKFTQSEGRGRGAVAARRLGQLIGGGIRGGGGDGRGRGGGGSRRRGASFNRRRGGGLGRIGGGGGVLGGCPRAATPLHDDARLNDVPEGPTNTTNTARCAGCSCNVAASASSANVAV